MTNKQKKESLREILAVILVQPIDDTFKDKLLDLVEDCFAEDKKNKEKDSSRYYNHPDEVYGRDWMDGKKC